MDEDCPICENASAFAWRVKELEKRDEEMQKTIISIYGTLDTYKNMLITSLVSSLLTLLIIIAMFLTR